MINCEFRLINGSSSDSDTFLYKKQMSSVPIVGELINIKGNPFVIYERGWAIGDGESYCYFRVMKTFNYTIEMD